GPRIALKIDDLIMSDEPIEMRASCNSPVALTADLVDPDTHMPVQQVNLKDRGDGWQHGAFEPAAPGYYRVRVSGSGVTQANEDVVAVAAAAAVSSNE